MLKEFLEFVIKALVDDPSEVSVVERINDRTSIFELTVAKSDIGKVIGKKGKTALALRTLLNAVSTKQGKRSELEIVE